MAQWSFIIISPHRTIATLMQAAENNQVVIQDYFFVFWDNLNTKIAKNLGHLFDQYRAILLT